MTGRILNITVTSRVKFGPPLLLNHLSTPHVTIASAVVASAAVPTFVHPVQLRERRDGREFPFGEVRACVCVRACACLI
jgi:predicted acylesterase/phospholipase RssA